MCKVYVKSDGDYFFKIYDAGKSKNWGRPSGWTYWGIGVEHNMDNIGSAEAQGNYVFLQNISKGKYKIFFNWKTGYMKIESDT